MGEATGSVIYIEDFEKLDNVGEENFKDKSLIGFYITENGGVNTTNCFRASLEAVVTYVQNHFKSFPGTMIQDTTIPSGKFEEKAIKSSDLADGIVTTEKIQDNSVTREKLVAGLVNSINPIGSIVAWCGKESTIPPEYLACNGQSIDQNVYPELVRILGSTRVPDLRGRFILGAEAINNAQSKNPNLDYKSPGFLGGQRSFQLNASNLPAHSHRFKNYYYCEAYNKDGRSGNGAGHDTLQNKGIGSNDTDYDNRYAYYVMCDTNTAGYSSPSSVTHVPPYYSLIFIIKAK